MSDLQRHDWPGTLPSETGIEDGKLHVWVLQHLDEFAPRPAPGRPDGSMDPFTFKSARDLQRRGEKLGDGELRAARITLDWREAVSKHRGAEQGRLACVLNAIRTYDAQKTAGDDECAATLRAWLRHEWHAAFPPGLGVEGVREVAAAVVSNRHRTS
jgi:hypothetical protein